MSIWPLSIRLLIICSLLYVEYFRVPTGSYHHYRSPIIFHELEALVNIAESPGSSQH